jgi:hypothetical protein
MVEEKDEALPGLPTHLSRPGRALGQGLPEWGPLSRLLSDEVELSGSLDPSPYLGTVGSVVMDYRTWIPLRCRALE